MVEIYTIYDHPRDFPDHFVIRKEIITNNGNIIKDLSYLFKSKSLYECRGQMKHLNLLPRHPTDDPVIVESYI